MEVRHRGLVLLWVFVARLRGVEQQRENSVEETGVHIDGADVAVIRKIARAEMNRLLRGGQQQFCQSTESQLPVRRVGAGQSIERVVMARGFIVFLNAFEQSGDGEVFAGGP